MRYRNIKYLLKKQYHGVQYPNIGVLEYPEGKMQLANEESQSQ